MGEPCSPNAGYCVRHKRHLRECNAELQREVEALRLVMAGWRQATYDLLTQTNAERIEREASRLSGAALARAKGGAK